MRSSSSVRSAVLASSGNTIWARHHVQEGSGGKNMHTTFGSKMRQGGILDAANGTARTPGTLLSSQSKSTPDLSAGSTASTSVGSALPSDAATASSVFNQWADSRRSSEAGAAKNGRPGASLMQRHPSGASIPAQYMPKLSASAQDPGQDAWDFESPWRQLDWANDPPSASPK